jgi:hypothetical protein
MVEWAAVEERKGDMRLFIFAINRLLGEERRRLGECRVPRAEMPSTRTPMIQSDRHGHLNPMIRCNKAELGCLFTAASFVQNRADWIRRMRI